MGRVWNNDRIERYKKGVKRMTREEAKRILYVYRAVNLVDASHREAFDMAIEALSSSENPNTCGDAISRQAVMEHYSTGEIANCHHISRNNLLDFIEQLPSVTPQQRTGRWIDDEFGSKCSCCGIYTHLDKFDRPMKFKCCSMCGARMEERENG